MVPQMESADEARRLVEFARFQPDGTRGVGVYYPDAMPDGLAAALALANREQLLIAQIETAAGGGARRTRSRRWTASTCSGSATSTSRPRSGVPGEFGHPTHTAAVQKVFAAAAAAGKPVGALATGVTDAQALLAQGYRALVYGDSMLFTGALRDALGALR